jgi:TfoX/Sxy family transcriptional regulator of competence genes
MLNLTAHYNRHRKPWASMREMKLIKPSPGLIAEFRAVVGQLPQGQPRKMFGYDAVFVNGNMAVGLWQNTCVVKVSEADQAKLIESGSGQPFAPMKGRVMSGWVELSEELAHDPEELLAWAQRAVMFVAGLPPKLQSSKRKPVATKQPVKPSNAKKAANAKRAATPNARATSKRGVSKK